MERAGMGEGRGDGTHCVRKTASRYMKTGEKQKT